MLESLTGYINETFTKWQEQVSQQIGDAWYQTAAFTLGGLLEVVSVLILSCMVLVCYHLIMNREEITIPFIGRGKPGDTLFFLGVFYFVVAILKAKFCM